MLSFLRVPSHFSFSPPRRISAFCLPLLSGVDGPISRSADSPDPKSPQSPKPSIASTAESPEPSGRRRGSGPSCVRTVRTNEAPECAGAAGRPVSLSPLNLPEPPAPQTPQGGRPPGVFETLDSQIPRPGFGLPRGPDCSIPRIPEIPRTSERAGRRDAPNLRKPRRSQPLDPQSSQNPHIAPAARPSRASGHFELRTS